MDLQIVGLFWITDAVIARDYLTIGPWVVAEVAMACYYMDSFLCVKSSVNILVTVSISCFGVITSILFVRENCEQKKIEKLNKVQTSFEP